jgi:hypothetical protein
MRTGCWGECLDLRGMKLHETGEKRLIFLIGIVGVESNWFHSALRSPMAYCASPRWLWWWRNWWNDWQGKPKYSEKTSSNAALSTTYPTCCPEANPVRRGGKPASNRLNYGTAWENSLIMKLLICTHQMFHYDQIVEHEIGRTCGTHGEDDKCLQNL